jgi:hypothetical protein
MAGNVAEAEWLAVGRIFQSQNRRWRLTDKREQLFIR